MTYHSEIAEASARPVSNLRDVPAPILWYETESARRVLKEIASSPDERPASVLHKQRFVLTTDEWLEWDREDTRVAALHGIYCGFHDAIAAVAPHLINRLGLDVSVDKAIDMAFAAHDARVAQDEEFQRLLDDGMHSGEARSRAYGRLPA